MISIRKYLDGHQPSGESAEEPPRNRRQSQDNQTLAIEAYRSALAEMGRAGVDVCSATGPSLERSLLHAADSLAFAATPDALASTGETVRRELQDWGNATARHFHARAVEVKQILLSMTDTVSSVGERDQRCADEIQTLSSQLRQIATLDDISVMRASIENSAAELKGSVDRLVEEGSAIFQRFEATIAAFQSRLEQAEQTAASDALTRLRSRLCVESQLEQRIDTAASFCIALFDLDGFKHINDTHGHVIGDEVLKQFATELRSSCRASDIVGRWGGDEFIVLLDCPFEIASAQVERIRKWVCGSYVVEGVAGPLKLSIAASVGIAQYTPPETLENLLARADAAMYQQKNSARSVPAGS